MLLLLVIIVHGALTKGAKKWAQSFVNTTLWLFFAFQLTILATVQPVSVKLVLKTLVTLRHFFIYTFNLQSNCYFVFILLIKLKELRCYCTCLFVCLFFFCNVVRTQWSPIRPPIIRVINEIATPKRANKSDDGSPICLITSISTDRIGRLTKLCYQLIITTTKFVIKLS